MFRRKKFDFISEILDLFYFYLYIVVSGAVYMSEEENIQEDIQVFFDKNSNL